MTTATTISTGSNGGGPLRVLYSFPTRIGVPGIGTTAWHQVAGLVAAGCRVTVFCGSCEKPIPGVHRVVQTMRCAGLRIPYRLLGDDRAFQFHDGQVARALRREPGAFDVVHGWPLGSLETLRAARDAGVTCFLERPNAHTRFAYDVVAREHERIGLPVPPTHTHAFNAARLAREEAEYALADKLLCPSEFVARTFATNGFAASSLARHQYGYSPDAFSPRGPHRDGAPFTVLSVGRCEPRKGLHYALDAWHESGAAAAGGRFIICGNFVPGYREFLRPQLCHPSVEERGFVTNVDAAMREADVVVVPSIEEGSALVTYEARGTGCVLLASSAAGAIGEDGTEILLHEPRDVSRLRQQMTELGADRQRLESMRARSLSSTPALTWAHAARVLLGQYRAALHA